MKIWTVKTIPVLSDGRIFSTRIDSTECGLHYVINESDGYLLDEFTPLEAESNYLSEANAEQRALDFYEKYGLKGEVGEL